MLPQSGSSLAAPPSQPQPSNAHSDQAKDQRPIEELCGKLVLANSNMERMFRRAKRAVASATEAEASDKHDAALFAKATSTLQDRQGLSNESAGRDCTEDRRARASYIVTSRNVVESLKIACTRANTAMSQCEAVGAKLCEAIEDDDGGLSATGHFQADGAKDNLDAIRLGSEHGALVALNFLNFFTDPLSKSEAET